MLQMHTILLVLLLPAALSSQAIENDLSNFNPEEHRDVQDVINELRAVVYSKDEPSFDANDENDLSELRRIIADHGFNPENRMADFLSFVNALSATSGIFKSGDARRWTTVNFAYQLACYQGRGGSMFSKGWWAFNTYNGYGCYCGGGIYTANYLDATDRCCKVHDECYTRVQRKYNLKLGCQVYAIPYSVSCCTTQKLTKCTDSGPSAARELCECDQGMSRCVALHKNTYNKAYYNNRSKCKTGTKSLSAWEIIKSCKDIFRPRTTFPITYHSQGSCPAQKKKGWWWGKKKDQE